MDHPRGCGENYPHCVLVSNMFGSPPRMRGKHHRVAVGRSPQRITPADAGKTDLCVNFGKTEKDHPRGCGENLRARGSCSHQEGSPPRMRGKLKNLLDAFEGDGITPADAGKTGVVLIFVRVLQDHPRGCGENVV